MEMILLGRCNFKMANLGIWHFFLMERDTAKMVIPKSGPSLARTEALCYELS